MKVLQIFNNWKWTGPAEYAFNLTSMLIKNGIEATFTCGFPPEEAKESLITFARERGLIPLVNSNLNKHFHLRKNFFAYQGLVRLITEKKFDIIHTHLTNGHLVAALAAKKAPHNPVLIRTCYESDGGGIRDRFLYKKLTDGIIAVANSTRRSIIDRCRITPEKVRFIPAAIDTERFDPKRGLKNNRNKWGIEPDATVLGIVARIQRHRRFHVIIEAVAKAVKKIPNLKVMVIGRGTNIKELAIDPVEEMGLAKYFVFTGYRKDDYVETLSCIDIKVFLVPGSDDSCRAVREAMALGKPVIVSKRGMLPEIVDHEVNGLVIDDEPEILAQAIIKLSEDIIFRERLGYNAFKKAHTQFSLQKQFKKIVDFYEEIMQKKRLFTRKGKVFDLGVKRASRRSKGDGY